MSRGVFFCEEVVVFAPVNTTCQRLSEWLAVEAGGTAAADALADGGRVLLRAGVSWLRKTVEVRTLVPRLRDGVVVMPMRWSATGPGGELFPTLDATLQVTAYAPRQTLVTLVGAYRPPLGELGAALDRTLLHHAGQVTIRRFLRDAPHAVTTGAAEWWPPARP